MLLVVLVIASLALGLFLFWYSYKNLRHVQKQEALERQQRHLKDQ